MRILISPDSFKECLTASEVAIAISEGILKILPDSENLLLPMADGGEGTVNAFVTATNGRIVKTKTFDSLNRHIDSFYGILGDGKTAVLEMAAASGIELLKPEERNPLITSTYGTGILLKEIIEKGHTDIIIGIGGSATNDGGAGMAQALGFGLNDINGKQIAKGGGSLQSICTISEEDVCPQLKNVSITIAGDVENILLGKTGATNVYAKQKGATPEMIELLEKNMEHFSNVLYKKFGRDFSAIKGSGAAGGLGAGLMAFCNAKMNSGFELLSKVSNLENQIADADIVFTGEGKIDSQTISGKTIAKIAALCKKHQKPLIAIAAIVENDIDNLFEIGLSSVFPIANKPMSSSESIANSKQLITDTAARIMRFYKFAK